jgi:hypothetical protein
VVALGLVAVDEQAVDCEEDDHLHESHGCGEEEAKSPFQRDAEEEPLEEADPAAHPPAYGRIIGLDAAAALSTHRGPPDSSSSSTSCAAVALSIKEWF